jgi:hypothetical protein
MTRHARAHFQDAVHDAWPDVGPSVAPSTLTGAVDSIVADTLRALAARTA